MRVNRRLQHLESRFERVIETLSPAWSDPEWYEVFAEKGREGFFRREPDFPRALADYGRAIAAAERIAPDIDSPRNFFIRHPRRVPRLFTWRNDPRFPEVGTAFEWPCVMLLRTCDRLPTVTEAQFAELAAWFRAHEPRLIECSSGSGRFDPGDRSEIVLSDLAFDLKAGPRRVESGQIAETVRRLRATYERGTLVESAAGKKLAWPPGAILHPDGDGMTVVLDRNL